VTLQIKIAQFAEAGKRHSKAASMNASVKTQEDSKRFLFIVLAFMLAGSCLHSCLTVDFVCFKISRRTCMMLHRKQLKLCKKLHQQRLLFAV
jgi:hypothetical protein